jgi:tetratricopeptide (TPR) repeat protein
MRRLVLTLLLAGVVSAGLFVSLEIRRDREYQRLVREGEAALAADETFAAIEALSGAIALKKDSMLPYLKRGEAYRRRGELQAALRDLRTASLLDPAATRPLEQLGDVSYLMGRYRRAAERYGEDLALDDRAPRVLYKLALARFQEGAIEAATAALGQALGQQERFPEAHYLLGLCLRALRKPTEARRALERAIVLSPAFVQAREELAALHRSLGQNALELEQLESLASLEPQRLERHIALGLAYARAGRTEHAVTTLRTIADRHPDAPQIFVALGRIWLEIAEQQGDRVALGKALEALQGAVAAGATTSESCTLLGRALLLAGEQDLALQVLQRATSSFPVEPLAYVLLAQVAEREGDLTLARDGLASYVTLVSDRLAPESHAGLALRIGTLCLRVNEPGAAVMWLRRAAVISTPSPVLLAELARAEWQAGQIDAARATIERGLRADPRNRALRSLAATVR